MEPLPVEGLSCSALFRQRDHFFARIGLRTQPNSLRLSRLPLPFSKAVSHAPHAARQRKKTDALQPRFHPAFLHGHVQQQLYGRLLLLRTMAGRIAGQPQLARHPALGPVRHGPALAAPGQHRPALAQQAACPAGHHLPFQLHHAGLSLHPRARQHLADPWPAHRPGHLAGGLLQLCGGRAGQLHPQGPERPGLRHLLPDHPAALFHHPGRGRADPAPAGR